jgi:hypothetical protein
MSAVTSVITGMATSLITEVLIVVAALAALVGIGILVAYGFRKLRSVGSK